MWKVEFTTEFKNWLEAEEIHVRNAVLAKVQLLAKDGPILARPHADTLKGSKYPNMKELRIGIKTQVIRAAFAFDPQRNAIVLCAANKAGKSSMEFYCRLIEQADRLYQKHLQSLGGAH